MNKHHIEDKIRQGYRVYDLEGILGKDPFDFEIDNLIEKLGPDKLGEVDSNNYLYIKTDPRWTDTSGQNRGKG